MIPLNLAGKLALVAGVGDDRGFAWHIAKALNAAGARLVFATHPRLVNVVENIIIATSQVRKARPVLAVIVRDEEGPSAVSQEDLVRILRVVRQAPNVASIRPQRRPLASPDCTRAK